MRNIAAEKNSIFKVFSKTKLIELKIDAPCG